MPIGHCAANCASTSLQAGEIAAACVARHCMIRPPPGATRRKACERRRCRPTSARTVPRAAASVAAPLRSARRCRSGSRCRGCAVACAAGRRRGAALPGRVDGLLAGRRDFCLVLFQALQRRRAAGRHAGADLLIVGAAGGADCRHLRIAGFLGWRCWPPPWVSPPAPRLLRRLRRCGRGSRPALGAAGAAALRRAFTAIWQPGERLDMFFSRHCSDASPPGGMLAQWA